MTDDQMRNALAEVSQRIIEYSEGVWFYWSNGKLFACKDNDPLEDLNAMHEAESVLTLGQYDLFCELLGGTLYYCARATARQRAEAFLRTLNLWKD